MQEGHESKPAKRTKAVPRDAAWEAAYAAQLTDALAASVGAFAKKRASWLEGKTRRRDALLWRELLQDALEDTWTGELTWDPKEAPLDLHLKGAIRSRTTAMMKHLKRFPRVGANAPRGDLEREISDALTLERTNTPAPDLAAYAEGVVGTLTMLAAGDDEVERILECFGNGLLDRRDIVRETGMTTRTYHNARRRLMGLVERIPDNLRDEAIRAMA